MATKTEQFAIAGSGLVIIIGIVYFLSRSKTTRAVTTANGQTVTPDSLTMPNITVPSVQPANVSVTPNNNQSNKQSCCYHCARNGNNVSAAGILSSGNFQQAIFNATSGIVNPTINAVTPLPPSKGPLLIAQPAGGLPLPSPIWWQADPLYRQAYIDAYNETAAAFNGYNNQVISRRMFSATNRYLTTQLTPMPYNYANSSDPTKATNFAANAGIGMSVNVMQGVSSDGSSQYSQAYNTMMLNLENAMDQLGDSPAGSNSIGVPDQSIVSIQ